MLTKYLPKINIDEFYAEKGNNSFVVLAQGIYNNYYILYKKDTEEPFVAKVFINK